MSFVLKTVLPVAVLTAFGVGACKSVDDPVPSDECEAYCEAWENKASASFDELFESSADCESDCMGDFESAIDEISECDEKMTDYMDCLSTSSQTDADDSCEEQRKDFMECADGVAGGPCDKLEYLVGTTLETACADYPDCSACDYGTATSTPGPTDEECQEIIDAFDADAIIEAYQTICEAETDG